MRILSTMFISLASIDRVLLYPSSHIILQFVTLFGLLILLEVQALFYSTLLLFEPPFIRPSFFFIFFFFHFARVILISRVCVCARIRFHFPVLTPCACLFSTFSFEFLLFFRLFHLIFFYFFDFSSSSSSLLFILSQSNSHSC